MKKKVLIVGASRGIGFSLVKTFLEKGHMVYAISRNTLPLDAIKGDYPDDQFQITGQDISLPEAKNAIHDLVHSISGGVDIVINNAGALVNKPFSEISYAELQQVYSVNLFGVFQTIQACLSGLSPDAHIINISSMGGFQGSQKFPGLSAYSSSKTALCGLTECLQEEFKETGWAFNALCLGAVQTEMLEEAFPGFNAPVTPEEMAGYIYRFSLEGNKFFKGKVLPVSSTTP